MDECQIKILNPQAALLHLTRPGDAGYDLRSIEGCVIPPLGRSIVSTGIALSIPVGYAGLVVPRSGLAINHGITVVNSPGLIDSNYRGEIKVILCNLDSKNSYTVQCGDRVAQLVFIQVGLPSFTAVEELPQSERGEAGFGSSGY